MLGFHVVDRRNQNIGDNKDVCRCLWRNVAESRDQFILIHDIGRNLAADNFTENGFFSHDVFLVCLVWCGNPGKSLMATCCSVAQHKSMSDFLLSFQPYPSISFLSANLLLAE
ncbi:hypothetical protein D3C80_1593190 [compost metagenome]